MVGSLTPNRVRHVDQAGKTAEARSPTAAWQRAQEFGCRSRAVPVQVRCYLLGIRPTTGTATFTSSLSSPCSHLITMTFQLQTDGTVRPAEGGIIRSHKTPSMFTDLIEMLPNKFVINSQAFLNFLS